MQDEPLPAGALGRVAPKHSGLLGGELSLQSLISPYERSLVSAVLEPKGLDRENHCLAVDIMVSPEVGSQRGARSCRPSSRRRDPATGDGEAAGARRGK